MGLGRIFVQQGRLADALPLFQSVASSAANARTKAEALYSAGVLLSADNDHAQAESFFTNAISADPTYAPSYVGLAAQQFVRAISGTTLAFGAKGRVIITWTDAANCTLTTDWNPINKDVGTIMRWTSANATSLSINNGIGSVSPVGGGNRNVYPQTTTTYTGTATGPGGTATCTKTVTVTPPATGSISVVPGTVNEGSTATLTWATANADEGVYITNVGWVSASGLHPGRDRHHVHPHRVRLRRQQLVRCASRGPCILHPRRPHDPERVRHLLLADVCPRGDDVLVGVADAHLHRRDALGLGKLSVRHLCVRRFLKLFVL